MLYSAIMTVAVDLLTRRFGAAGGGSGSGNSNTATATGSHKATVRKRDGSSKDDDASDLEVGTNKVGSSDANAFTGDAVCAETLAWNRRLRDR